MLAVVRIGVSRSGSLTTHTPVNLCSCPPANEPVTSAAAAVPHVDAAHNAVEVSRRDTAAGARKGSIGERDSAQSTEVKASSARDLLVMVKHYKVLYLVRAVTCERSSGSSNMRSVRYAEGGVYHADFVFCPWLCCLRVPPSQQAVPVSVAAAFLRSLIAAHAKLSPPADRSIGAPPVRIWSWSNNTLCGLFPDGGATKFSHPSAHYVACSRHCNGEAGARSSSQA